MQYGTGSRFRNLGGVFKSHFGNEAASEIIENPQSHLLTQEQLFEAEGGVGGVFFQLAFIGASFAGVAAYCPRTFKYLARGNATFANWFTVGATAYVAHRIGYVFGATTCGDYEKVNNHFMAFTYQRALNRMEGTDVLMKAPGF